LSIWEKCAGGNQVRNPARAIHALDVLSLLFGDGTSILHDAKLRLKELVATFPDV
jgi:hypothetical protein